MVHDVEPVFAAYVPATLDVDFAHAVILPPEHAEPFGHTVCALAFAAVVYDPLLAVVHVAAPALEYVPATLAVDFTQAAQAVDTLLPVALLAVPAAHWVILPLAQ